MTYLKPYQNILEQFWTNFKLWRFLANAPIIFTHDDESEASQSSLQYIQEAWHFALQDVFIYKKEDTLRYPIFHEIFEVGIYTKSMTLCVTWRFCIQKDGHFAKSKTIFVTFYIQKYGHFALPDFSWNFWNWWKGGGYFYMKKKHFALSFYMQKTMHFSLRFYSQKSLTLCVTFLYKKNNALCVTTMSGKLDATSWHWINWAEVYIIS